MLCTACSTTLDPTLTPESAPIVSGGTGGADASAEPEPMITPRSLADCPTSMLAGHQYFACAAARSFAEAGADCANAAAVLVKVDSAEETELLKSLAFPGRQWGWIGASRNSSFDWSWLDGTPFWHGDAAGMAEPGAYTNWHDGEPDNTSDTVRQEEACATFDVGAGGWTDRYCDLVLPYVCELGGPASATGGM
jgi:hypothetical protein